MWNVFSFIHYIFQMTRTCPHENRSHKEISIEYLKNQTNPGETQF